MLKKILCAVLAVAVMAIPVFAAASFSDLPESHWGYPSVSKLVDKGTINGYEDGTFRPAGTVTRAEFVKMMGEGTVKRESDYADVSSDHWAYKYVMTSQFDDGTNNFKPSQPITREETIVLLWKRAGAPEGNYAPSIVTNQAFNKEAVAWAYSNGIMLGDDGVNMRLTGTLSRVEAAALIVRTSETDFTAAKKNFIDNASGDLLKRIYESFHIFDNDPAYSPEKTITNGELSRAALRIAESAHEITYGRYPYKASFSNTYAKDVAIMCNLCFGADKATAEFADKKATKEDMVAALTAAVIMKTSTPVSHGKTGNYYKDVAAGLDKNEDGYLTFAYEKGVSLYGDGTIGAGQPATYKDVAAVLLQLDDIIGTQTVISSVKTGENFVKRDVKLNHNLAKYPSNHADYVCISENVPNAVYEKPFKDQKSVFDWARGYGEFLANYCAKVSATVKNKLGVDMEFVIYPELVWDNGNGIWTVRALCKINGVTDEHVLVSTLFSDDELIGEDVGVFFKKGMEFFVDVQVRYLDVF